jgi:hypothetical protein
MWINDKSFMGKGSDLKSFHAVFNLFERLMKKEKYVCLAGDFISVEEESTELGKKIKTYWWIFKNLKTKKGSAV